MIMSPVLSLIAVAALIIIIIHKISKKQSTLFPPGPGSLWEVPLVGHLHLLGKSVHKTFFEWSQNYYGAIFSIQLGEYNTVVINDYKLIRKALNDAKFNGRSDFESYNSISEGKKGILNGVHGSWMELHKFTLQSLRDVGAGGKSMDNLMQIEMTEFLDSLAKQAENGQAISLENSIKLTVLNLLWTIIAGERLERNDPTLIHLLHKITAVSRVSENAAATFLPTFAKRFPTLSGWNEMIWHNKALRNFQKRIIKEHEKTLDNENPRDIIDLFLVEMKKCQDPKSSFYGSDAENQLIAVLNDLMVGGCGPTSAAMLWAVLYLATNTQVQRELQSEIDSVIGRSCLPTMSARPKMPYAIAVLMETLRKSSIFPLGIFHATTENTEFHGFQIPKDTPICMNLWAAHHDPQVWGDPHNFRPERFLSSVNISNSVKDTNVNVANSGSNSNPIQKRKLERHEASLPFSFGKRTCLGELLAKEQLFLFILSIFQRFDIQLCAADSITNTLTNAEPEPEKIAHKHLKLGSRLLPLSKIFNPIPDNVGAMAFPPPFTVFIKERA